MKRSRWMMAAVAALVAALLLALWEFGHGPDLASKFEDLVLVRNKSVVSVVSTGPGWSFSILVRGKATVDDQRDVVLSLEDEIVMEEVRDGGRQKIRYGKGPGGEIVSRYFRDGVERPIDPDAARWLHERWSQLRQALAG